MSDEKKAVKKTEENTKKEVRPEDLEKVAGGSINDVVYTPTNPIDPDTQNKV